MENVRLPKQFFYGEFALVRCLKLKPSKPYNFVFKDKLKKLEISVKNWEIFSKNRSEEIKFWRLQSLYCQKESEVVKKT